MNTCRKERCKQLSKIRLDGSKDSNNWIGIKVRVIYNFIREAEQNTFKLLRQKRKTTKRLKQ